MTCRVSTVGQPKRDVSFESGETLGGVFARIGVDIPAGSGVEVWVNGEKCENMASYVLKQDDAIVLMPALKGQVQT